MNRLNAEPDINPMPRKAPIITDAISFSWESTTLFKNL